MGFKHIHAPSYSRVLRSVNARLQVFLSKKPFSVNINPVQPHLDRKTLLAQLSSPFPPCTGSVEVHRRLPNPSAPEQNPTPLQLRPGPEPSMPLAGPTRGEATTATIVTLQAHTQCQVHFTIEAIAAC